MAQALETEKMPIQVYVLNEEEQQSPPMRLNQQTQSEPSASAVPRHPRPAGPLSTTDRRGNIIGNAGLEFVSDVASTRATSSQTRIRELVETRQRERISLPARGTAGAVWADSSEPPLRRPCSVTLAMSCVVYAEGDEVIGPTEETEEYEDELEVSTEQEATTREFSDDIAPLLKEIQRRLYPTVSELLADPDLSTGCTGAMLSLLRGVQNQQKWAFMIATASGTIPQNLFLGAQGSFGSYDQCLEAERINADGLVDLRGQYCTLYLNPNQRMFNQLKELLKDDPFVKDTLLKMKSWPKEVLGLPTGLKLGLCTPNLCSPKELNHILDKLVNKVYGTKFEIGNCRIKHDKMLTPFQRFVIASGYGLLLLVVAGTTADFYLNRVRDEPIYISPWFAVTLLMMFSARRNVLRLFTPYTPQTKELGFLNGIKVLLACWVVYGHSAIFISPDVFLHLSGYVLLLQKVPFQIVANSFMAVSSFFFL
ncbi:nose resistant to fluoxetine protein 6-like, partial [Tropilaelaps mercedesae]